MNAGFDETLAATRDQLAEVGFGILPELDMDQVRCSANQNDYHAERRCRLVAAPRAGGVLRTRPAPSVRWHFRIHPTDGMGPLSGSG